MNGHILTGSQMRAIDDRGNIARDQAGCFGTTTRRSSTDSDRNRHGPSG